MNSAVRSVVVEETCCGFLPFSEDCGGPRDTMKMDEVNVGGLGVGVTVDIQRTDGEWGKRRKNGVPSLCCGGCQEHRPGT